MTDNEKSEAMRSFASKWGVRKADSARNRVNVRRFLRSAPLWRSEAGRELSRALTRDGIDLSWIHRRWEFDHFEVWCRSGFPFFLISHPYQLSPNNQIGDTFRRAGYNYSTHNDSWYKNGDTVRVEVMHPAIIYLTDDDKNIKKFVDDWVDKFKSSIDALS